MPGTDIFLSYASEDRQRILPLVSALRSTNWTVFWDRTIPAGKTWRQVVGKELDDCRSIVVVWSRASVKSDWVLEEADRGRRRGVLLPLRIDEVQPPLGFGAIQAADLVGWDGTTLAAPFQRLVNDLGNTLGPPPAVDERGPAEEDISAALGKPHLPSGPPSEPRGLPPPASVTDGYGPKRYSLNRLLAAFAGIAAVVVLAVLSYGRLRENSREPGDEFRDCGQCPEMVVVPTGGFEMGSPSTEDERGDDEGPRHPVKFEQSFAVGKYEVTFDEWDACVAEDGCTNKPSDRGWGRGRQPVVNVNWEDAQNYVTWLSKKTGKTYRLLSEAEWEYAARAGTTTRYPWGNEPGKNRANFDGSGSRWSTKQTAPVGSFEANAFGLYDMIGNVWEWVQDCGHENYKGAPADGRAWEGGEKGVCGRRVWRGGSTFSRSSSARAANRGRVVPKPTDLEKLGDVGFRVAQTL